MNNINVMGYTSEKYNAIIEKERLSMFLPVKLSGDNDKKYTTYFNMNQNIPYYSDLRYLINSDNFYNDLLLI